MNKYSRRAILCFILIINALLKWRFFCGLNQADDFQYGVYSYTMFRLPLPWDMSMDFRALRLALLLPVNLLFRFISPNSIVPILYPLLISFGTVFMVYIIGRKLYGVYVGLFSAFVIATFPADIVFGTMLLPDIIVPFFLCVSVYAFLKACDHGNRRSLFWYLISGFFVFLAFNTRENSYYFLLFFLPFTFNRERWKRGIYLIVVGFTVPILILYSIYYLKSGDFLFHLHLAQATRDSHIASGYIPANAINQFTMLYYMIPGLFRHDFSISGMFGYTFYIGIPCVIYVGVKGIIQRNKSLLIILWWFLIVYLFLEFGTLSYSHYQMMKKLPRFLLTLTPAMALAYGVVLSDAFGLKRG
ncbi:MAG TPA: hypothetical protein ENH82_13450 [bacterium]|nr:hypothetical protein [bacterium]